MTSEHRVYVWAFFLAAAVLASLFWAIAWSSVRNQRAEADVRIAEWRAVESVGPTARAGLIRKAGEQ
jgi:hypothetical protein